MARDLSAFYGCSRQTSFLLSKFQLVIFLVLVVLSLTDVVSFLTNNISAKKLINNNKKKMIKDLRQVKCCKIEAVKFNL